MQIEHIMVLILENRSFDHMLGFLDHPESQYPRLSTGQYTNPWAGHSDVPITDTARYLLPVGPAHKHKYVQRQLENGNKGFVSDYVEAIKRDRDKVEKKLKKTEKRIRWLEERIQEYVPGTIIRKPSRQASYKLELEKVKEKKSEFERFLLVSHPEDNSDRIMQCFHESKIPVLSKLAKEFCVFTDWYSSVPGMTWPNRAYAIAATSDGEVDIKTRLYRSRTIFEDLSDQGKSWSIYHDGPSHTWAYPALWFEWGDQYKKLRKLTKHIKDPDYDFPSFCFVEPNHGLKFGPLYRKKAEISNNQHPGENEKDVDNFVRGEKLIADIYDALKANPERFEKTLFLITYDEHGGIFDHKIPPAAPAPGDKINEKYDFKFDSLGVRVPAVAVSPWIPKGKIDKTVRDHSAIPKTAREVFLQNDEYLSNREKWVPSYQDVCSLVRPRKGAELPTVHPLETELACEQEGISESEGIEMRESADRRQRIYRRTLDDFEQSLVELTAVVEKAIEEPSVTSAEMVQWDAECVEQIDSRFTTDRDLGNFMESVSRLVRAKED